MHNVSLVKQIEWLVLFIDISNSRRKFLIIIYFSYQMKRSISLSFVCMFTDIDSLFHCYCMCVVVQLNKTMESTNNLLLGYQLFGQLTLQIFSQILIV